jgi:hypothetical protein
VTDTREYTVSFKVCNFSVSTNELQISVLNDIENPKDYIKGKFSGPYIWGEIDKIEEIKDEP